MLVNHKQIDKSITMKNQNKSAALGRPAMKSLCVCGGGVGSLAYYSLLIHYTTAALFSMKMTAT